MLYLLHFLPTVLTEDWTEYVFSYCLVNGSVIQTLGSVIQSLQTLPFNIIHASVRSMLNKMNHHVQLNGYNLGLLRDWNLN